MAKRILVYGTLRKGHAPNRELVIRRAEFKGEVRVPGYDMYKLGWFPGAKENPDNKDGIVGELYEIPDNMVEEVTKHLDYYEGYLPDNHKQSLFLRTEVNVQGEPATMYLYNGKTEDLEFVEKIPSGDWSNRIP